MKWTFWTRTQALGPDDCAAVEPLLSLYADGMASAEEVQRVETHLADCADCRASLAWIQATQRALTSRPVVSPPADLRVRIAEAIAASSASPVPASFAARPARTFVLRPALAAAASAAALGFVSYALLHPHPQISVHTTKPPQMASARPTVSVSPLVKPAIVSGVKPPAARHTKFVPKAVRANPSLVAQAPLEEAPPEPVAVKTPAAAGSGPEERPAPSPTTIKPHLSLMRKPTLPKVKPEMMAITKHQSAPVGTPKPLIVQPKDRNPDLVATTAPPTLPATVPVNVGPPSIKADPPPTVVAAGAPDSHAHASGLLSLSAYVGHMKSFTHSTVNREAASGATYALRTMDTEKPGIDFVHGPLR